MLTIKTIKGSREEVLKAIRESTGEIVEAIVFVEDHVLVPVDDGENVEPPTVAVENVDDSREAIYTRQADE